MSCCEKMISDQKVEEQNKEIHDLQSKNDSLVKEVEYLHKSLESVNIKMKGLENQLKCSQEKEAENAKLKLCIESQQTQLKSVTKSVEAVKCQVMVERKSMKCKIANLTAELLETKKELQKKNNTIEANQHVIKDITKKFHILETANDILFVEASNQPTHQQLEELQKQIFKLEVALEKKDMDYQKMNIEEQKRWEILTVEKDEVIEKMKQSFDEERLCFEVAIHVKEKEVEDSRNKFRNACYQADLIKSDLKKHRKNLLKHFQALTKAMRVLRNLNGKSNADVLNLSEKVLDSLVKTLVGEDQNFDKRAEGLHEYLCQKNPNLPLPVSRSEENNNAFEMSE